MGKTGRRWFAEERPNCAVSAWVHQSPLLVGQSSALWDNLLELQPNPSQHWITLVCREIQPWAITCYHNAGINGSVSTGTYDHHVVCLYQFSFNEELKHFRKPFCQGVAALNDVDTVITGAGCQPCQPGQLCWGHRGDLAGHLGEGLGNSLLVLTDFRQVGLPPRAHEYLLQILNQRDLVCS